MLGMVKLEKWNNCETEFKRFVVEAKYYKFI